MLRWIGYALLVAMLSGLSAPAQAVLWGTQSQSQLADVLTNNAQTNPTTDGVFGSTQAGEGVFFTQSEVTDLRGTAEARAGLQFGNNQVPVLRARSVLTGDTTPGGGVNGAVARADAFASEIFQYNGLVARSDLQITFTLTGTVVDLPAEVQTFIVAKVAVFEAANYFFDPALDNLLFGPPGLPVAKALDDTTLQFLDDTGGPSTLGTTLTFAATPGEIFYVHMSLFTSAFRDTRSADAFSTLSAEFLEPALFDPLSVPEPATALLLAWGALLFPFSRGVFQAESAD